jgi:hypothetical protein
MKRIAMIAAALLIGSAAHAQTRLNSTPTGAAVPSEQQTTGSARVAPHGSDRPQSPVNSYSGNVTHSDEQAKGLVPGNTSADGGEARNQGAR